MKIYKTKLKQGKNVAEPSLSLVGVCFVQITTVVQS
jgi:hypothetical protein